MFELMHAKLIDLCLPVAFVTTNIALNQCMLS